jgi:hypothetical protein
MRILADAAEDEGNPTLAAGWRWLADNRRWPLRTRNLPNRGVTKPRHRGVYYLWSTWSNYPSVVLAPEDHLPVSIADLIESPHVTKDYFHSGVVACDSLTTLLELTAQAAGEHLAAQRKEG